MRILHLIPALHTTGGVERGTIDLALSLKKLNQTVIVVSNGGRFVKHLEDNGITHINLPIHKKSLTVLALVPRVASVIKSHKIDIVHASSRVPAWVGFLACKLTKTTFVTSCHGYYSNGILSSVMGWGKLVMVVSKSVENRMKEAFSVPQDKIRLVYRGLDLKKYPYDHDKYKRKRNVFTIINIGRLTPIKGQYEFIQAMKRVTDKIRNVEALIVGGTSKKKYENTLKTLTKELGMEDKIKFLGVRSDVPQLLSESDCLVLSSNIPEGFGRTVIEAGAVGCVCCASGIGGIKEIIEDGVSGLLFPPKDSTKMADTIVRALGDIELRKKCTENLRKKVEKDFTLEKMTRLTLSVYEEALGNAR